LTKKDNKTFIDERHVGTLKGQTIGQDGKLNFTGSNVQARIYSGKVIDSPNGKAFQLLEKHSRVELLGLSMPDNAFSISMICKRGPEFKDIQPIYCSHKIQTRFRNKDIIWANYYRNYTDRVQCNGGKAMKEGRWFRMTVTYGSHVKVYVDGELIGQKQVQKANQYTEVVDARPYFLELLKGDVGGALAEVNVYNKVLSHDDIKKLSPAKN
jgi:hypothetical protein